MNRLQPPRRFPMTLASLAMLTLPSGCGSDTKTTAEVPTPPAVVVDAQPAPSEFVPTPLPRTTPGVVETPGTLDQAVHQAAGEMKHEAKQDAVDAKKEVRDAEGDVKKAVADVEGEAKHKAKEIEADARKAAEEAIDRLLPSPR